MLVGYFAIRYRQQNQDKIKILQKFIYNFVYTMIFRLYL